MYLGLSDAVCGAYYACYGVLLLLHSSLSNLFRHYAEYTELAIITPLLFPELTNLCGLSIQPIRTEDALFRQGCLRCLQTKFYYYVRRSRSTNLSFLSPRGALNEN